MPQNSSDSTANMAAAKPPGERVSVGRRVGGVRTRRGRLLETDRGRHYAPRWRTVVRYERHLPDRSNLNRVFGRADQNQLVFSDRDPGVGDVDRGSRISTEDEYAPVKNQRVSGR